MFLYVFSTCWYVMSKLLKKRRGGCAHASSQFMTRFCHSHKGSARNHHFPNPPTSFHITARMRRT